MPQQRRFIEHKNNSADFRGSKILAGRRHRGGLRCCTGTAGGRSGFCRCAFCRRMRLCRRRCGASAAPRSPYSKARCRNQYGSLKCPLMCHRRITKNGLLQRFAAAIREPLASVVSADHLLNVHRRANHQFPIEIDDRRRASIGGPDIGLYGSLN